MGRRVRAPAPPVIPEGLLTVAHLVAVETRAWPRMTVGPLEAVAGVDHRYYVLAPAPGQGACACDEAEVEIADRSACPQCYGDEVASAARAGALRSVRVWGTITLDGAEFDEDRPPRREAEYALGPVEAATIDPGGAPLDRPDVVTQAAVRLRDLALRIDALAASTWDSPWHEAALALRRSPIEGPVGAAALAVAALEALVAHAEYRRAF